MKRRREELKWPSNEELVSLICEPACEVTNANGKITIQHLCPHPYCNHKSGLNLIGRQKGKSYASVVTHLKACIGRHSIDDLYNLYTEIKEHLQDRKEILKKFRADVICSMKPNSGEIVQQQHVPKRRKHYELLSASELQDVKSSLEHICMLGGKNRHDERRRRLFETSHEELLEKEHNLPLDAPPVNPFGPPQHPDNNLFAEDVRLYGKHEAKLFREVPETASPMQSWPCRETHKRHWTKKGRMFDDKAWNVEHGDTINPLAFAAARLSQKVPSAADQESMNGSNLLVDTTNVGLHETQVPQALLLRCWERAVHASSCMTSAPKYDVKAIEVPFSAPCGSQTGLRKNNDCPRCWMQRAHCICKDCPPLSGCDNSNDFLPQLNRIFLIMHHKEIAMKVDTAKLILGAFPDKCRLVVAGIGPEYQASMKELYEAMEESSGESKNVDNDNGANKNCLVLFPDENAKSIEDILKQDHHGQLPHNSNNDNDGDDSKVDCNMDNYEPYDLIVLDGTWAQARKIHTKYIAPMEQGGPRRVQLSESATATLQEANDQSGHQLRRHTVAWRQVGTYEATRLFIKDLEGALPREWLFSSPSFTTTTTSSSSSSSGVSLSNEPVWKQIAEYQSIANEAARRELGPPRQ